MLNKDKKATGYVYGLYVKDSELPFYVGISHSYNDSTTDTKKKYRRAYEHIKFPQHDNERTRNVIQNNEVDVKILFENLTADEIYEKEIELIQKYGRQGIDQDGILTNIASGGNELDPDAMRLGVTFSSLHKKLSSERLTKYNKSEQHRKDTAYYNSIHPKISSKESREKLAKSQSETWWKKSKEERLRDNVAKSLGRAWKVMSRIEGDIINEKIYNTHRTKGSRTANTEPLWKSIVNKVGSTDELLKSVELRYNRKFKYES